MKSINVTGSGQCRETFVMNFFKNNIKIATFDKARLLLSSYYKFIKYKKLSTINAQPFNSENRG